MKKVVVQRQVFFSEFFRRECKTGRGLFNGLIEAILDHPARQMAGSKFVNPKNGSTNTIYAYI